MPHHRPPIHDETESVVCRLTSTAPLAVLVLAAATSPAHAMDARPAAAFADSVGVNVHMSYTNTPYADVGRVRSALSDLGVRHVRDTVCGPCGWERDAQAQLGASGVLLTAVVGGRGPEGTAEAEADLDDIAANRRWYTDAVEAVNEPDNNPTDPDWAANTRAQVQDVAGRLRSDPRLAGLPLIGPALVTDAGRRALGDLSPWVGFANSHPYRIARAPEDGLDAEDAAAESVAADRPIMATEAGYRSEGDPGSWNTPISERLVARYLPRVLLEGFRRGWTRTFDYELIDTFPAGTTAAAADQTGYGLLRSDGTPRPAYAALEGLMDVVGDAAAPSAGAAPLDLDLGGPSDLRHVLLRRADGSYVLALWRPNSVWDTVTRTLLPDLTATATVVLPATMRAQVDRITPTRTTTDLGSVSRVSVPVSGDVTFVSLRSVPATAAPVTTAPATPTPVTATTPATTTVPAATATVPATAPTTTTTALATAPLAQAPTTVPTQASAAAPAVAAAPSATTAAPTPTTAPATARTVAVAAGKVASTTTAALPSSAKLVAVRAVVRANTLRAAPTLAPGTTPVRVTYLLDDRPVARRTGAPWGVKLPLRRVAPGRHQLRALVRMRSGALVRSPAVAVVVRRAR